MLRRLSIRAILGITVGGLGLLLVASSIETFSDAFSRRAEADRAASLTAVSRQLFGTLVNSRRERGPMLNALAFGEPADEAGRTELLTSRKLADQAFSNAQALLADAGYASTSALTQGLVSTHDAMVAFRPQIDEALRRPRAARDPKVEAEAPKIIQAFIDRVIAAGDLVEGTLMLKDATLDQLLTVKKAAWSMRSYAGLINFAAQTAVVARKPWNSSEILAVARDQGRMLLAWSMLTDAASRSDAPKRLVDAIDATKQTYMAHFDGRLKALSTSILAGQVPDINVPELIRTNADMLVPIVAVADTVLDLMVVRAAEQKSAAQLSLILHGGQLLLAFALTVIGFGVAHYRIGRPIQGITAAMRRLATRDMTGEIPGAGSRDEIGEMAAAVVVFRDSIIDADRLGDEQQRQRAQREQRTAQLETLVTGFEAKVGSLVGLLSSASTEMEATARSMSMTALQTNEKASVVAAAAGEASIGAQTVAAATEQLTCSIGEISHQVANSTRMTVRAVEDARRTNGIVQTLDAAAEKIGDVVGLISNIAKQTNLLALNATIEAARAGDAGKGFAVVASEVKGLASQTAKATDEVATQITHIQAATQEAVAAIRGIAATIEQVSHIATSIASAVEEQGAATSEIARNVQQTSTSTQEVTHNITGVSQAANDAGQAASQVLSAATQLSRQASELTLEVREFVAGVRAA